MLNPGDVVDGRFVVEQLVGQGGLAEVYRVRHAELGSVHALKLLVWKKKQLEERLLLEGRIQAQLRHPNIVAVTDLVRHDGQVGLLMEFIEHETLEDFLVTHERLSLRDALEMMAAILSAVSAAHAAGVLHRDLKPANVLLDRTSSGVTPKVADFGIAKVVQEVQEGRTAAGSTMGTPGYLAPEQILDSADVDRRADVFALGAILYELLAGTRAFADEQGEVSVRSTLEARATPLDEVVEGLNPRVVAAVHQALARDRDDRFAGCDELAEALFADFPELLVRARGRQNTGMLSLDGTSMSTLERTPPSVTPPPSPATTGHTEVESSKRLGVALVAIGLLGGAVLVGAIFGASVIGLQAPPAPEGPGTEPVAVAPAPVAVAPEVAPAPSPEVTDTPAPEDPGASTVPVPSGPAPAPTATPSVVTAEAPAPSGADPVEEPSGEAPEPAPIEPAPAEPDAVVELTPAPPVAPDPVPTLAVPELVGTWKGEADGRPIELRITSASGSDLRGELTFYQGPTARTLPAVGTVDPATSRVSVQGGTLLLQGTTTLEAMSGQYKAGRRSASWNLSKTR